MRVHHRLGLQARTEPPSRRLGGLLGGALAELLCRDRLAYRRVVFSMSVETPHGVIAVGAARQSLPAGPEPPPVHNPRSWPLLRPGLDPLARRQRRALPWEARPAHAGPHADGPCRSAWHIREPAADAAYSRLPFRQSLPFGHQAGSRTDSPMSL